MSAGELTLNINQQCGKDGDGTCKCGSNIPDIRAREETNQPVAGFTKYTHYCEYEGTFKLKKKLGGLSIIEVVGTAGGRVGPSITDVKEVAVYYWDGDDSKPILIGITKKDEQQPTFYGKYATAWGNSQVNGLSEQQALDHQNCQHNQAVPFDIQDSQSAGLPKDYKSECIKSRSIDFTASPPSPPESEYTVKSHTITGVDTKISRVILNGNPTDITFTRHDAISEIRLYSYPASIEVPLMVEFKPRGGGTSTFYTTKNQKGTSWSEVRNGNSFYDKWDPTPKDVLSDKLDEVLCSRDNVTLDISLNNSKKRTEDKNKYCCAGNHQKITVTKEEIKVNGEPKTEYYKHSVQTGQNIAGIKYSDSGKRQKVKIGGLPFSSLGSLSIYVFYCKKDNPVLVYVDSTAIMTKGWYRKSRQGDHRLWTRVPNPLKSIKPTDITDCSRWNILKTYLEAVGCGPFGNCHDGLGRSDAIPQHVGPIEASEDENLYQPPTHKPPLPPDAIINIRENVPDRSGTKYYPSGGTHEQQVRLKRSEYPANSGFVKFTHQSHGGQAFHVAQVKYGKNQIPDIGVSSSDIQHLSVWYWSGDSDMRNPLLIEILKENGDYI